MNNFKKILASGLFLMFLGALSAQDQPTFSSGQNPTPTGKKWQKIENMSDEFDGTSLNTTKWDDQDPQWEGRKPARFEKSSVSVSGGDLKIVASKKTNPFNGWTHNGGLVRSKSKTTYGYFETRVKGNRTFLSTTFWLINKRNDVPTSSCDYRVTELDILETVGVVTPGAPNWAQDFEKKMNMNTHSREAPNAQSCGTQLGSKGAKYTFAQNETHWEDYHVYGVWWKSATEVIFYYDGRKVAEITPEENFDIGMYLRMVVESYSWNPPSTGNDNIDLPLADRTSYYDWTRSWKLVDCNGDCPNNNPVASVDCNSLPSSVVTSTAINVPVDYVADQNRDVVVELWDTSTNTYLKEGKTTVSAGSGTANVTITFNTAPATGNNYQFKASIRPVGTNWQQNLDACNKSGITLNNTPPVGGTPDVDCNSLPSSVTLNNGEISVSVDYTSDQNRDVVIELWNTSNNSYITESRTTVAAGTGTATVVINTTAGAGSNYQFKASIRPVGTNWQQNLDACNKSGITLSNTPPVGGTPDVDCNSLPSSVTLNNGEISVSVDYTSDQNRDVVIELWNTSNNSYITESRTTVTAGTGTATVVINTTVGAGSNYQFKASIRPVGTNWQQNLDACNKSGITIIGNNNCNINWTSPNQSITQTTSNWTSPAIDISCAASVNISMDIEGLTPAQMEASDYLNIYYSVDGGTQIPISENTDGFALKTVSANGITGNSLVLIINGKTSWSDETYNINNISVQSSNTSKSIDNKSVDAAVESLSKSIVYPNPVSSNSSFNISLSNTDDEKQISIFEYTGKLIYQIQTRASKVNIKRSELTISQGIYLIKIDNLGNKSDVEILKLLVK